MNKDYLYNVENGTRLIASPVCGAFTVVQHDPVLYRVLVRYDRWPESPVWKNGRSLLSFMARVG